MSLYGKTSWTRLHAPNELIKAFETIFESEKKAVSVSAVASRAKLVMSLSAEGPNSSAVGINPPAMPCGDVPEPDAQKDLDKKVLPYLHQWLSDKDAAHYTTLWTPEAEELADTSGILDGIGTDVRSFRLLDDHRPVFGLWFVFQEVKTPDDLTSLKEHSASRTYSDCFKRLSSEFRKEISKDLEEMGLTKTIARKAVPVILDGESNSIWIASVSNKMVEGFIGWANYTIGVGIEKCYLHLGGLTSWPADALALAWEENTFALETREAYEAWLKKTQASTEEEVEGGEITEEVLTEAEAPEEEKSGWTGCIAQKALDSGIQLCVQAPASINFGKLSHGAAVAQTMDALHLLYTMPDSRLASAQITIYAGNEEMGTFKASFEFHSGTVNPLVFRNLEVSVTKKLLKTFEEPYISGTRLEGLDDNSHETNRGGWFAPRVNRLWFRYLLLLRQAENGYIDTFCELLTLDPDGVVVTPKSNRLSEIEAEHSTSTIADAAQKLHAALVDNLEDGESVTLITPTSRATVTKGQKEVHVPWQEGLSGSEG